MGNYYGGTESPAEAAFMIALERVRTACPEEVQLQYPVTDGYAKYKLDFAWPSARVVSEINGREYHTDPRPFTRDQQKQRFFTRYGWKPVPFSGSEVMGDADYCVEQLFLCVGWKYPDVLEPRREWPATRILDAPGHVKPRSEVIVIPAESGAALKKRMWSS